MKIGDGRHALEGGYNRNTTLCVLAGIVAEMGDFPFDRLAPVASPETATLPPDNVRRLREVMNALRP